MAETYQQSPWSLADLIPGADGLEVKIAYEMLDSQVAEFEALRSQLSPDLSEEKFLEMIGKLEAINRLSRRPASYAQLGFAANTQDQALQAQLAEMRQRLTVLHNRLLFFELWWKELDDANAQRLMAASGDYRYWLEEMRHFKPHTLTEPEEKIVNLKNVTGSAAIVNLYDSFTNRYTFKLTVDGEEKELTRGELMVYARHHDPNLRAAAYQELYRVYGNDGPILAQMYQALVRDWRNEQVELRHFPTPISARNLENDIPDSVVETLLEACRQNAGLFHRFFRLKARWLGVERLRRYDIYAPVAKSDKTFPFGQAVDMVLGSFGEFDPGLAGLVKQVIDRQHLDSEVRKGKQGGAFCSSPLPELSPWVLVNYQGRADDVATLAHEMGHAVHAMLARHHSVFTFHSSLPLAETASTFGEMLLIDRLLASEPDEAVRRDVLFRQIDDAYATIMRQAYFAMFEKQAHEMIHNGASANEVADAYLKSLREQFGDAVEVSDEFRWEWVSIPHFYHVPFYVYAYAFGLLLVFSLYQQYRLEGEAFKPRYLKILSAGGSDSPERILTDAGIDMRDPAFWQGGFDVLDGLISRLEAIPMARAAS